MRKDKPIQLGIIGLGRAGWGMHCKELEGKEYLFAIAAACDTHRPARERMAAKYPHCRIYDNIDGILADEAIEMVTVATRSVDHCEHAMRALKAGKDVFLEKPLCVSHAEAKRLAKFAAKAPGNLYIRHNRRFETGFLHIREILASGILGDVHTIKLARVGYERRCDWQTLQKNGGGQLLNWGPHIVDHALQFLGAPEKPLTGIWGELKRVVAAGNAEDHVKVVLTGANGCVVDIEISGGAAVSLPQYVIWGTKGGLTCSGDEIKLRYLSPKKKLKPREVDDGVPDGFGSKEDLLWIEETIPVKPKKTYDIWDELYRSVQGWQTFPITMDEAVEIMRVVSAVKKGTEF